MIELDDPQGDKFVAFSPDGSTLLTQRRGDEALLWTAPSLTQIDAQVDNVRTGKPLRIGRH